MKEEISEEKWLGEKIRQARVIRKVSQGQLGKILGMSKQTISKIEKGQRQVTVPEMVAIMSYLNVSMDLLFNLDKTPIDSTMDINKLNLYRKMWGTVESYAREQGVTPEQFQDDTKNNKKEK